jgi:RNA polymerase sigma factor (sigma-70 family)
MKVYRCSELGRLAHELSLSPQRHRLRQVMGIQRAIELIDPEKDYPYSFLCYQITGYRPRRTEDSLLGGREAVADLARMLDELTAANALPMGAAGGRLYDVEALAHRFNVSTKTISRWRERGLGGCWYWTADGQGGQSPRLAFSPRSVECFVARHRDLIRRGSAFQLMDEEERDRIIARAQELVATEKCGLHAVARLLSEETGRALETIRYTLRRFDREHPGEALFDRAEQAQEIDEETVIYAAYAAGESVRSLAGRFGKREAELRRILTRVRAVQLAAQPVKYVYNDSFDLPDAGETILGGEETGESGCGEDNKPEAILARMPSDLPAYLRDLYRTPLLGAVGERLLFRRMNFLRHQAELRRRRIAAEPASADEDDLTAIDELLDRATAIKNRIIRANLRLVVSIARRHLRGRTGVNLFELISDGNLALMRAVEKFDYARGFRFSTYGSWAIMRSFARTIPEEMIQLGRFQTGREEMLADAGDHREIEEERTDVEEIRSLLAGGLRGLSDRERSVVERHFGLGKAGPAKTLDEIGRDLGISKERVRQIEVRALAKLRWALGDQAAALLAG